MAAAENGGGPIKQASLRTKHGIERKGESGGGGASRSKHFYPKVSLFAPQTSENPEAMSPKPKTLSPIEKP